MAIIWDTIIKKYFFWLSLFLTISNKSDSINLFQKISLEILLINLNFFSFSFYIVDLDLFAVAIRGSLRSEGANF